MPAQITAYAIYNGNTNTYYGDDPVLVSLNCLDFAAFTPIQGWLKRRILIGAAGGTIIQYLPTFSADDPEIDINTLEGVFVQQGAGLLMINAVTVQDVIDTCDNCCDGDSSVTPFYASALPAFVGPSLTTYTVTRTDAGTPGAVDQFSLDYMDVVVTDPIHSSWVTGTSTYKISCFGRPTPVGTDIIT